MGKRSTIDNLIFKPKVKIGEQDWSVVWVDRIEGKDTLGYCDDEAHVIMVMNGQETEEALHTYLHEVMHAMCDEYRIRLGHKTLDKLAGAFKDFLIQNKVIK